MTCELKVCHITEWVETWFVGKIWVVVVLLYDLKLFCEDGEVNPDYFPSSLLELQNSNPNLNVPGLENQDCGYQILSPTNEHEITGSSGFNCKAWFIYFSALTKSPVK